MSELADGSAISAAIDRELEKDGLNYVEFRPTSLRLNTSLYRSEHRYWHHRVDLRPDLSEIFGNCHKDSIQRKIRRAEREGITYQEGRSESLLLAFYRLWVLTRRRHCAPPQALSWFRNLTNSFGDAAKIRIASKDGQPVAAILTLCYRDTLMYKYGCSDAHFHNLGGMHLLLWNSIQEAKAAGLDTFDLGRSDPEGAGLIRFKDRWGASRSELAYSRVALSPNSKGTNFATNDWKKTIVRKVISQLPDSLFCSVGQLLYPHIG